jgi:hypothetical protein
MAAALCYGVRGGGAQLCFHITAGNYDTDTLIEVLQGLRRFLGGEKATLLWDGLPAHRSRAMQAWLNRQRSWLVVERPSAHHRLGAGADTAHAHPISGIEPAAATASLADTVSAAWPWLVRRGWSLPVFSRVRLIQIRPARFA